MLWLSLLVLSFAEPLANGLSRDEDRGESLSDGLSCAVSV
jgi:hypothetical protein